MNIYIVQGGIGKHIMFSSMIEKLCEKDNEKIIIMSAYPDLFKFHPKVEKSVTFFEAGFYDKYVNETENNIICREPYFSNYVKGKTHLIEEWAKLHDIEYTGDIPDIYVDNFANEESERFIQNFPNFIITQFSGGQSPINFDANRPFINQGQVKDYPRQMAQELIDKIKKKYPDMTILNYALPNEQSYNLKDCIHIESPYLFYVSLLNYCKSFISIDSSLQHFAANRFTKKKGVVIWGATSPTCLGYEKNINLSNKKDEEYKMRPLCNSVGDVFNEDGSPWKNDDPTSSHVPVSDILENLDICIKENEDIKPDLTNIIENTDMIKVNDKMGNMLAAMENQMKDLNLKYQTTIEAYVASQGKEGNYQVSKDGKRLVKSQ